MDSMIYDPLEEYESKFKYLHLENTKKLFEDLVLKSGVNIDENRKTVKKYNEFIENISKLRKKLNLLRFFRVLMILTILLIPFVIALVTPKIRALRREIESADNKSKELLELANSQMAPLNRLFTDRDAIGLIQATIPSVVFEPYFSVEQEFNMETNFDFDKSDHDEVSTTSVLAGHYNENPFLFETKKIHTLGTETYHGYKTIRWTERYRGSDGKMHTRVRTQTLHATVVKPKPFYHTQVVLNYCAQGGPELSFTRDATHLEEKSEKEIDKYVKKGEKKLKKMTDKALKNNDDFQSMSNSDFEVLFDALDRTNEVQFRTLFTPLAQTNMVSLIRSKAGYGDDFNFIKTKRTNKIISHHSQGRAINLLASAYFSYSYDIIENNFVHKNADFFKDVYFDFAPLWAIPIYQERPVHSLNPIPKQYHSYTYKECESLLNRMNPSYAVHPSTKTEAILKSSFASSQNAVDEITVSAFSYDIIGRVDVVPMLGGDGNLHNVLVPWDDYIPLTATNQFFVTKAENISNQHVVATQNGLSIFN